MPDDLTKKRPLDSSRINIHEPYEVKYWSQKFGIMPSRLKELVAKYGTSAAVIAKMI
ncbi:hypothetical protein Pcar_3418 [Syntrophotalea carbinolica DSM 2380]|uniref:DUF3606 domain-containing protein n=1 Tax=Syntrophotalea carbinolica (strain DSM 2380 / NBRC 103641 / GraBd1) TaxID=338963 RepID=J9UI18_SYNC1|nr:DUF3606 domain-containing protein [Syntrophotalea carbinolica]AFR67591.1 hypothetical protein Pcar_3418 [Syntrophotalea carbinolica DSM 2380]